MGALAMCQARRGDLALRAAELGADHAAGEERAAILAGKLSRSGAAMESKSSQVGLLLKSGLSCCLASCADSMM